VRNREADVLSPVKKVSFIVPAYNEECYLAACLASIRQQRGDFEIVVVDNSSTDRTGDIARQFADRVVFCPTPGIAAARNCGAQSASSEVLAFVDADARLNGNWLKQGLERMLTGGFDAVCGWNYFAEDNPLRFCFYNTYSIGFLLFLAARSMAGRPVVAGNNLLIRKRTLDAARGFPRFVGEDIKLSSILNACGCRVGFSPSMRISYSSRRFRREGFFRVIGLWLESLARDIPEATYALDYNRQANRSESI
jgi:glycosyltransferase involved in cell wall biosynthesis